MHLNETFEFTKRQKLLFFDYALKKVLMIYVIYRQILR